MAAAPFDDVATMTPPLNATEVTSSSAAAVHHGIAELLTTVVTLVGIILATVVGNAFVIAAVLLERNLRSHVANYLVASLAVADLLVAVLVMPLAAVNEVCAALSAFSPSSVSSSFNFQSTWTIRKVTRWCSGRAFDS